MRALLAYADRLTPALEEVAPPALGAADVRIKVAAAGVNPVDVGLATGRIRAAVDLPDPIGLGWDVSGIVIEVGGEVTDLRVGDRVAGLLNVIGLQPPVGTHADETVLPASAVARVPDGLDLVEAASLPLNSLTASQALGLLGPGEGRTLLVTGGAGAVGGYAIALAARSGWQVSALARSTDADFVARAGATLVTDLSHRAWDAVLDAAVLLGPAMEAVRDGGSFVNLAPGAQPAGERGITVRTVMVEPDSAGIAALLGRAAEGSLEVRVAGRLPLPEAVTAYDKVAAAGQRGRWLLLP